MLKPNSSTQADPTRAAGWESDTGGKPAFEALFDSHWNRVIRLVTRLVGDPHEAEDLALEAFLKLHDRLGNGILENPGGWLYRAATRLGYNALRSQNRRNQYEEAAGRMEIENSSMGDPVEESEARNDRELVRRALSSMKPRNAELLALRYSGLSYGEIASAMKLSPGSVGTLLARAEKEFEKRYQKLEGRQE